MKPGRRYNSGHLTRPFALRPSADGFKDGAAAAKKRRHADSDRNYAQKPDVLVDRRVPAPATPKKQNNKQVFFG
ncbi:hypothetical protein EYF80_016924 [Liparis tanakae]|uniref:Uncharacterized protein n=1 Tax=Liparis tanakae TaxID=230148 RepID=A0A4Z2I6F8_9TELE|nr:hypothetical protein EYF80_016924 [Liparis tanakae]